MATFHAGDRITTHELESITGAAVPVPDPDAVVHLHFRRFAGCPICHTHMRALSKRYAEIAEAGIREVVVFHSEPAVLREHESDLPFDTIADPEKALYRAFGVERSVRGLLQPQGLVAAARGFLAGNTVKGAIGRGEDHLGLPADFLIAPDGTVLAAHYGTHFSDQWSVDELLSLRAAA